MKKLIIILILFPMFCFGQNVITHAYIEKNTSKDNLSPYDIFYLKISPGYKDQGYKIEVVQIDNSGKEIILTKPEISVDLLVYKKNYRMPDGKEEWDYETVVKSNDIWTDEYLDIGDCSNSKLITCTLRLRNTEKYKIRIYQKEEINFEFLIVKGTEVK